MASQPPGPPDEREPGGFEPTPAGTWPGQQGTPAPAGGFQPAPSDPQAPPGTFEPAPSDAAPQPWAQPQAPPAFAPAPEPAPPRRRRALIAAAAVVVVAAGVVAFLLLRGGGSGGANQNKGGGAQAGLESLAWSQVQAAKAFGGPGDQQMWRTAVSGSRLVGVGFSSSGGSQEAAVWAGGADGTVWTRIPPTAAFRGPGGLAAMSSVVEGGPGFVAVGLATSKKKDFDAAAWTSEDGTRWTAVRDPKVFGGPGAQVMNRVAVGGPGFVAVGFDASPQASAAAVWTSSDGLTWQRVTGSQEALAGELLKMRDVTAGGPGLVAVGFSGPKGNSDASVWTSTDGLTWERVTGSPQVFGGPGPQVMATVVPGGPGFVAVGSDGGDAAVWTSKDATTWTKVPPDPTVFGGAGDQIMNFAVSTPKGIVAVGADGEDAAVWTSSDGEKWRRDRSGVFVGPGQQQAKGIILSGNRLIVTGWDGRGGDLDAAAWIADLPK